MLMMREGSSRQEVGMGRLQVLAQALGYIEAHLRGELTPDEVADSCGYSLSALQKMFRYAFRIGVKDYIARRRITLAARDLLGTKDTVLTIALRYGYESHEVFTRAFRRIWGETPSVFRRERGFADIYPQLQPKLSKLELQEGGFVYVHQFNNTDLYDAMKTMNGTWAVAFDTCHLMEINNNYGHMAGDLAIAECIKRIDTSLEEGMAFFRIGGDEFILLTASTDQAAAQRVADAIIAHNGAPITFGGKSIPISLRYALTTLDTRVPDRDMMHKLMWHR